MDTQTIDTHTVRPRTIILGPDYLKVSDFPVY